MCRILGITNFSYKKHEELLEGFWRLAENGKLLPGDSPGHTDGWGIGYYRGGRAFLRKSGGSAVKERKDFFGTLRNIPASRNLIVHLRKSSWKSTNSRGNSHPFRHNNIIFGHNGTIYDYKKLLKDIGPGLKTGEGALDSEIYFLYIMNRISGGLKEAFKKSVADIKKHNKYSSLSCVFTDGERLYSYREFSRNPDYYTLYSADKGGSKIVCSEPLPGIPEWELLGKNKLYEY